jgi:hypothetical protein
MSHKAIALLEKQDFKAGFELYKSRYNLPSFTKREYNAPHWNGERVKLLAIHGEQGVGDEIMFSTLFHAVKERVDSIVIECEPRVLKWVKPGVPLDFPDLVLALLKAGERVVAYPSRCQWLDIGRPDDYRQAQELFTKTPGPSITSV